VVMSIPSPPLPSPACTHLARHCHVIALLGVQTSPHSRPALSQAVQGGQGALDPLQAVRHLWQIQSTAAAAVQHR
jgi:hypothetical protein